MPESFDHWDRHLGTDKVAYYMAMTGNPLSPDIAVSAAHVTDRKQGLLLALEKHTPTFFSFAGVRHIVENVKHSIFMNQDIHLLIWKAGRTSYPASYTKALEELHAIDSRIFDYLTQPSLAETWADCTLSGARFGDLTSNNAETGQSLTVKLREQNVLQLLSAERSEGSYYEKQGANRYCLRQRGQSLINSEDLKNQFTVDITLGHQDFAWPREENHVPSLRQMCICCGIIRTSYLCEHMAWVALHCNIDPNSIIMKWRTSKHTQSLQ
eukprot:g51873.t1